MDRRSHYVAACRVNREIHFHPAHHPARHGIAIGIRAGAINMDSELVKGLFSGRRSATEALIAANAGKALNFEDSYDNLYAFGNVWIRGRETGYFTDLSECRCRGPFPGRYLYVLMAMTPAFSRPSMRPRPWKSARETKAASTTVSPASVQVRASRSGSSAFMKGGFSMGFTGPLDGR